MVENLVLNVTHNFHLLQLPEKGIDIDPKPHLSPVISLCVLIFKFPLQVTNSLLYISSVIRW